MADEKTPEQLRALCREQDGKPDRIGELSRKFEQAFAAAERAPADVGDIPTQIATDACTHAAIRLLVKDADQLGEVHGVIQTVAAKYIATPVGDYGELIARLRGERLNCECTAWAANECSCDTDWPADSCREAATAIETLTRDLASEQELLRREVLQHVYQRVRAETAEAAIASLQRERDDLAAEYDATIHVIGDFMLVPPDGGDLKLHEGAQQMRDALAAEREAHEATRSLLPPLAQERDAVLLRVLGLQACIEGDEKQHIELVAALAAKQAECEKLREALREIDEAEPATAEITAATLMGQIARAALAAKE